MNSICHTHNYPATLEVWPSIAIGLPSSKHGAILNAADRPTRSRLHQRVTKLSNFLSDRAKNQSPLGRKMSEELFPQTEAQTVFENGKVKDWPGVTPCRDWQQESAWFSEVEEGKLDVSQFKIRSLGHVRSHLGWLAGMTEIVISIAGVHIHYLDYIGYIFAKSEDPIREAYLQVDSFIGWLRQRTNRLIKISDPGMQTTITDDSNLGVHSPQPYISSILGEKSSMTVLDIRDWIKEKISLEDIDRDRSEIRMDTPCEYLEDLEQL